VSGNKYGRWTFQKKDNALAHQFQIENLPSHHEKKWNRALCHNFDHSKSLFSIYDN